MPAQEWVWYSPPAWALKWIHWRVRTAFGDLERIKTEKLNDESIRSKYVGLVSERLANVNLADLDVDDCWNVLEESMVDSAKNVCGCAKRTKTMKGDAWFPPGCRG
ncbi:hypothetical protein ACJJTC_012386 [Scirpophaga incertulas]